jgi:alginate O-acetyltransferase complex protein AlgI
MLFHTTIFSIFLVLVVLLTILSPRILLFPILIVASYFFYGWGAGFYIILLFITSLIDYGIAIYCSDDIRLRKYGIIASGIANFGVLAYFKYANFAIINLDTILAAFDSSIHITTLNIALPIGISFYTFQSFAYVVDVLTGKVKPCKSLPEYLLFSSWFPQLVAGPISRAEALMPQLENLATLRMKFYNRLPEAIILFSDGWLRKFFGDLAGISAQHFYQQNPLDATGASAFYGIIAFGLQIYGDFSGYTRMAQGVSWLFGVRLTDNFNVPYAAYSIQDFWRRWHISLSTWFRDYVYIPLGGNKKGPIKTYINLGLTMVLCGLWHGASWNFIFWGSLHGGMLIIERLCENKLFKLHKILQHSFVILFVFLAWVPFRAADLDLTFKTYAALLNSGWYLPPISLVVALIGIAFCDLLQVYEAKIKFNNKVIEELRASIHIILCLLMWKLGKLIGSQSEISFLYFQF